MPEGVQVEREGWFRRALPALTLMFLAPMVAEVLPGATRISSIFVLPIEIVIWGGGAVMIREVVRRRRLGWLNMLLLAMALALAEECLIQQTSLAPTVIKLKGEEYARAFGVNYLYLLWALVYESLFVVFIPVGLTELVFWRRREEGWLNGVGMAIIGLLWVPACFFAWFTWTQIARTKVFHLEAYTPPASQMAAAVVAIVVLISLAIGPGPQALAQKWRAMRPPHPVVLFVLSGLATAVIFGLVLLGFGIRPEFPPAVAVAIGLILAVLMMAYVPSFYAHETWSVWHEVGILYGAMIANMGVFFVGFIGATPVDFYGKVVLDGIAVGLLVWLAVAVWGEQKNRRAVEQ